MTVTTLDPPAVAVTPDELITIALQRLDRLALRIAASKALHRAEIERHANIADLGAAYAALRTHQRLRQQAGRDAGGGS